MTQERLQALAFEDHVGFAAENDHIAVDGDVYLAILQPLTPWRPDAELRGRDTARAGGRDVGGVIGKEEVDTSSGK